MPSLQKLQCSEGDLSKDLTGKVVMVTGATSGIGFECAKQFYLQGATVVLASRSKDKLDACTEQLKILPEKESGSSKNGSVDQLVLDLGDLDQVKSAAQEAKSRFGKIDILLNNAGVMNLPKRKVTAQGLEAQIATNHFGHFLFTELLLDHMNDNARIVNVSSCCSFYCPKPSLERAFIDFEDIHFEKREYEGWRSYAQSKLANVLHAMDLAQRPGLKARGITAVSLHPGVIMTDLYAHTFNKVSWFFVKPVLQYWYGWIKPWDGSQTSLHCCLSDDVAQHNGAFFAMSHLSSHMEIFHQRPELNAGGWPMRHPALDTGDISDEIVAKFRDVSFQTCEKWLQEKW